MLVTILTIAQVIVALALIVVVLLQHGKQQGLSGAIAGGAETFFGKNKGRTVDVMLKKFTSVVAILFIILSLSLTFITGRQAKVDDTDIDSAVIDDVSGPQYLQITDDKMLVINEDGTITDTAGTELTFDENAGYVYEDGSVYVTMDEFTNAVEAMAQEADASADVADETQTDDTADTAASSEAE